MRILILSFLFVLGSYYVSGNNKYVICYYGTWATYRSGLGKFDTSNINTKLCTHIVYTFVGINNNGEVISLDPYLDLPDNWGRNNFGQFNELKKQNANLKTILAVGGWNEGSAKYSTMAANTSFRKNFVTSAVNMILKYGFDGLDLDWEYPNRRDTVNGAADVNNFTLLLKELREQFNKYGLLLTAAVSSVKSSASLSYNIPNIVKYLDLVNVMTYDMYGGWDSVTGHNAPLHKGEGDNDVPKEKLFTVDVALEYWLNQGCPPDKLILGLPFYGHSFKLANSKVNSVRAPSSGTGIAGPYTATSGVLGYNEFCYMLQTEPWEVRYDDLAKVPYAVKGANWVSYDNPNSLAAKIEYGLKYNIAGVMIWSIETDDFHGICHSQDFPLLRSINAALGRSNGTTATSTSTTTSTTTSKPTTSSTTTTTSTSTTSKPTTTTVTSTTPTTTQSTTSVPTSTTTTKKPTTTTTTSTTTQSTTTTTSSSVCTHVGLTGNPKDCRTFFICVQNLYGGLTPILFKCPSNLHWDQSNLYCNYPRLANCRTSK